jgi:hypothetical protein
VVLPSTTSCPERSRIRTSFTAETMNEMSGSLVWRSGVGTQMLMQSARERSVNSDVAVNFFASVSPRTCSEGTSPM